MLGNGGPAMTSYTMPIERPRCDADGCAGFSHRYLNLRGEDGSAVHLCPRHWQMLVFNGWFLVRGMVATYGGTVHE